MGFGTVNVGAPKGDYETPLKNNVLKESPVDADRFPLVDSADGSKTKLVLWGKIKEMLNVLFVPLTRKINNKTLDEDISLTASDVGAAESSHSHGWDAITGDPLPVTRGGTGQSTLDIAPETAGVRKIYAGTTDMTAGTTSLDNGVIYLVYE